MGYAAKCQDLAHKRLSLAWARFKGVGSVFVRNPTDSFIIFAMIVLVGTVVLLVFMWVEWRAEHEALARFLIQNP